MAIAGVGPYLSKLAGEVCDGFHVHPFHTVKYLDEVVLPNIRAGAEAAGRRLDQVDRIASVFVVTGRDEAEMAQAVRAVKTQIAFYASTPSYRVVLDTHGWDFGGTLSRMSRRGEWESMADVVPDEVVEEAAVVVPPEGIGRAIKERYGGRIQRVGYYGMGGGFLDDDALAEVVASTR